MEFNFGDIVLDSELFDYLKQFNIYPGPDIGKLTRIAYIKKDGLYKGGIIYNDDLNNVKTKKVYFIIKSGFHFTEPVFYQPIRVFIKDPFEAMNSHKLQKINDINNVEIYEAMKFIRLQFDIVY